ncbi:MAG: PIN domain-containing protein [Candidatus Lokiarchaeota archaeon]|nr:PIN domain-containing protein [Candidatus Lokiarchaeota archaeon]
MMKVKSLIFDTTYIFPLFGIKITDLTNYEVISDSIWEKGIKGYELIIPSTCLMEVMYKLLSEYKSGGDISILNRYSIAIPSLLSFNPITLFDPLQNPEASRIASVIRHSGHKDMMDCLIAATAIVFKGILISEDSELKDFLQKIPDSLPLTCWSWKELRKKME